MANTERLDEIEKELEALKAKYNSTEGTVTEVYSRIVGYYRSVKNWNKGKTAEYRERKIYEVSKLGE